MAKKCIKKEINSLFERTFIELKKENALLREELSVIKDKNAKDADYARLQPLLEKFKAETGSIICKELLAPQDAAKTQPTSEARTAQYYKKRPCAQIVGIAAQIVEDFLKQEK